MTTLEIIKKTMEFDKNFIKENGYSNARKNVEYAIELARQDERNKYSNFDANRCQYEQFIEEYYGLKGDI